MTERAAPDIASRNIPDGPPRNVSDRRPRNRLAVASFVLGLLWIGGIGAVLAIAFGGVALDQVRRYDERGRGLAIAGLVLGVAGAVLAAYLLLMYLLFLPFDVCRDSGSTTCLDAPAARLVR